MNRREHLKMTGLLAGLTATGLAPNLAGATQPISHHPRLERDRCALVFIEFQNEWLEAEGPLHRLLQDRRQFEQAVANARQILARARVTGWHVVHAGLSLVQDPTYGLFGGGFGKTGLRGAIPRAGTWRDPQRVAFAPDFTPQPGEFVVTGRSGASVLTNSTLDAYLRNNRLDQVCLLGFALHVCVESTLRQAHDLGYDAWIIDDAAPAFTAQQREHVLREVVHHFGAHLSTAAWLAQA